MKKVLTILLIILIWPYYFLKLLLAKKPKEIENILIINNAKIGDLVVATPLFRAIKEKYPKAKLTLLVTSKTEGIIKNNPRIDEIIVYPMNQGLHFKKIKELIKELKSKKFDTCINVIPGTVPLILPFILSIPVRITTIIKEYGGYYAIISRLLCNKKLTLEKDKSTVKHYLNLTKFIGVDHSNFKKEVFTDSESLEKAERFYNNNNIKNDDIVVGISLSAGNKIKEWGTKNFSKLSDLIQEKYHYKVVMLGAPQDKELIEHAKNLTKKKVIATYNEFSLKELPALIKRLNYFISVDTGTIYIANALDIPVLDIVGPCNIYDQPPIHEKCEVCYNKDLYCWPCSSVVSTAKTCKEEHIRCLKEITPSDVLTSFDKLVNKYGRS